MVIAIIFAIWATLGIIGFVYAHTQDSDLRLKDLPYILIFGSAFGPLAIISVFGDWLCGKYPNGVLSRRNRR